jgi:hypothetical protein
MVALLAADLEEEAVVPCSKKKRLYQYRHAFLFRPPDREKWERFKVFARTKRRSANSQIAAMIDEALAAAERERAEAARVLGR